MKITYVLNYINKIVNTLKHYMHEIYCKMKNKKLKKGEFGKLDFKILNENKEKLDEIFKKKNYDINYFREKFKKKWNEYALKIGLDEQEKNSPKVEDFVTYIVSVYGVPKELAKNIKINFNNTKKNILDLAKNNADDNFDEKQFEELVNQVAKIETAYVSTGGKYDPEYVKKDEKDSSNITKNPKQDIIDFISSLDDEKISKVLDILKKSKI